MKPPSFLTQERNMADALILAALGFGGWLHWKQAKQEVDASTLVTQGDPDGFQLHTKESVANLGTPIRNQIAPPDEFMYRVQDLVQRDNRRQVDREVAESIGAGMHDTWVNDVADGFAPKRDLFMNFHDQLHANPTSAEVQYELASDPAAVIPGLAEIWKRNIAGDRLLPHGYD